MIWFNGGPGCSSLLGFIQENGPFVINDNEYKITKNDYPWNLKANVLYIESPAGVGYSYAKGPQDRIFDDELSSHDNLTALQAFYKKFPEYKQNELFVTGESYAGIYVPYLAHRIVEFNKDAQDKINLKGILVGNGATDWDFDTTPSYLPMAYWHNLMDKSLYDRFVDNQCFFSFRDVIPEKGNIKECDSAYAEFQQVTKDIFWYDIYMKTPNGGLLKSSDRKRITEVNGELREYKAGYTMNEYTPWAKHVLKSEEGPHHLLGDGASDYLNRADVRKTLHAKDEIKAWEACAGGDWTYNLNVKGSVWIYPTLIEAGVRVLIYSGDTDGAVPTYGSEQWINSLNLKTKSAYREWSINKGETAGFFKEYEGLDLCIVHGTGHMAPQWKKPEVTHMVNQWIRGDKV